MNKKSWMPLLIAAGVAMSATSLNVAAQSTDGYWRQGVGGPVWKNPYNQCWRGRFLAAPEGGPRGGPRLGA